MFQYFIFTEKSPIIDAKEIHLSGFKEGKIMYINTHSYINNLLLSLKIYKHLK